MLIRDFVSADCDQLVEVLKANLQFGHPEIDGPGAMLRICDCDAAEFLVAEEDGRAVGLIRGVFDGSRAIVHVISVHPDYQRRGIGTALVSEIAKRFQAQGANNLSVVAAGNLDLLKKLGFKQTIRIMTAYPIGSVIREPSDEK
jgi:ribosomal protein S18 acetylase RimI-like enzyme